MRAHLLLVYADLGRPLLWEFGRIARNWVALAPGGGGTRKALLCGAVLSVLGNFRFEAILFGVPIAYYLLRGEVRGGRPALGLIAAFLVSFSIPMAPWIARNYQVFDSFVLGTSGGYNLLRGHHANASGTGRDPWPAAKLDPHRSTPCPSDTFLDSLSYSAPVDELMARDRQTEMATRHMIENPRHELRLLTLKSYYFLVADITHAGARLWPTWLPSLVALLVGFQYWIRRGLGDPRQQLLWMVFLLPRYRIDVDFVPLVCAAGWIAERLAPRSGIALAARGPGMLADDESPAAS